MCLSCSESEPAKNRAFANDWCWPPIAPALQLIVERQLGALKAPRFFAFSAASSLVPSTAFSTLPPIFAAAPFSLASLREPIVTEVPADLAGAADSKGIPELPLTTRTRRSFDVFMLVRLLSFPCCLEQDRAKIRPRLKSMRSRPFAERTGRPHLRLARALR